MNVYLHKTVKSGKEYAKKWTKLFKQHVLYYYPETIFSKKIKQVKRATAVDEVIAIAQIIDMASHSPAMGLNLGQPKLKFQMSKAMEKVFTDDGIVQTKQPLW